MSNDTQVVVWRGKTSFAKILGDPVKNIFDEDQRLWSMDLVLDPTVEKEAKSLGISDKIKKKEDYLDGKPFVSFRQPEFRKNPDPITGKLVKNDPIKVVDAAGNEWDQSALIGNGSTVDAKFMVVDRGKGQKKGVYLKSVRVLDRVVYERKEFEDLNEDDEFYSAAQETRNAVRKAEEYKTFQKDFGLDDGLDDIGEETL